MAYKGKILSNPLNGQDIIFLQTAKDTRGRLLEMKAIYAAGSKEPIPHYHPAQEEDFEVLEGILTVRINGTVRTYEQGECFHIPKGVVHSMWNAAGVQTVVNWQVRPALHTEHFLEIIHGLIREGKVNNSGRPSILQVALIMNHYSGVFRMAKPPEFIQKILFGMLTPIAWLAGYRSHYKKYID